MNSNMHATIEQILEIIEGEQNAASAHVRDCERCQQEIVALKALSQQLFDEADQVPDAALWDRIEATVSNAGDNSGSAGNVAPVKRLDFQHASQQRPLSYAIYTLAASILITGFIGLFVFSHNLNDRSQTELLQANIQQLMINSRGMEQALEKVSLQSELLTASERSQADRLYWQLAYLDQRIHESNVDVSTDPQRVEVLWNDRVQALRDLNQLYYRRQQALDDSEI